MSKDLPSTLTHRQVFDIFGDKWSIQCLTLIAEHSVLRFSELLNRINEKLPENGVSKRMLAITLRSLEVHNLISRHSYPQVPPRVEYQLTEMGKSLLPKINDIINWAKENSQH